MTFSFFYVPPNVLIMQTFKFQIPDDESDLSVLSVSEEETVTSRPKKKKKSRAIREDDLSKEERTRAEIISVLCEKYKCNIHSTPCYI